MKASAPAFEARDLTTISRRFESLPGTQVAEPMARELPGNSGDVLPPMKSGMKPVIVFDLNETLLDLSALDATFARILRVADGTDIRKKWFKQVLELFLTATVTGQYRRFDKLTDDALQIIAVQRGGEVSASDRTALAHALGQMPAHADVRDGLEQLKRAGTTIAVLTNSTRTSATSLLDRAGLLELFDHVLSADAVERYKPAPEAYAYAARELNVGLGDIVLVAAHGWDIAGALAAGCRAVFVRRPGAGLSPGQPHPEREVADIRDFSAQFVASHA